MFNLIIFLVCGIMMTGCMSNKNVDSIWDIGNDSGHILSTKTKDLKKNELSLAIKIGDRLKATLATKGKVSAGLAAPQIGISRSVFIYSFDRRPENLTLVINPTLEPMGDAGVIGWEACYSGMLKNGEYHVAKIRRFERIRVTYFNESWEKV
jgi:peptide deformylase